MRFEKIIKVKNIGKKQAFDITVNNNSHIF